MKIHVELTRTIFTNFTPMLHFYTPWKCQKIKVFWRFQGIQKWNIGLKWVNPFRRKPTQWSNTLKQFVGNFSTNCLSVSDHFVKLALEGLNYPEAKIIRIPESKTYNDSEWEQTQKRLCLTKTNLKPVIHGLFELRRQH